MQTGLKFPERELDFSLFKVVKLSFIVVVQDVWIGIVIVEYGDDVMVDRGDRSVDTGLILEDLIEQGRGARVASVNEGLVVHEKLNGGTLGVLGSVWIHQPKKKERMTWKI